MFCARNAMTLSVPTVRKPVNHCKCRIAIHHLRDRLANDDEAYGDRVLESLVGGTGFEPVTPAV